MPSIFNFIIHNPLPTYNVIHHEQQEDSHHVIPCTIFRCRVTFCFAITRPAVQWAVVTVQACDNALLYSVTLFCCVKASTTVDSRDNPGLCPCSAVTLPALSWSCSCDSLGLPWFCCDNASSAVTSRDNPGLCPFPAVTRPAPSRPCCRDSLGLCPCSAVTWPALPRTVVTVQACAQVLLCSVPMFCCETASAAVDSRDNLGLCPCSDMFCARVLLRHEQRYRGLVVTVQACAHVLLYSVVICAPVLL